MKKKIIVISTILVLLTSVVILGIKRNESKEEISKNISIVLEKESGNVKSNSFPNKENYEYDKVLCENLKSDNSITPTFNSDTWKLNISANSNNNIDGKFNCTIYFKEKVKTAADTIIAKYSETNTEGLIKIDQEATGQTPAQTEYRYNGSAVKNYVSFNNETWRIVGIFDTETGSGTYEKRLKLVKEESIGNLAWNTKKAPTVSSTTYNEENSEYSNNVYKESDNNYILKLAPSGSTTCVGCINQWGPSGSYTGASLMEYLNGDYYNTLTSASKNLIDNVKWYISNGSKWGSTLKEIYNFERASTTEQSTTDNITRTTNWVGKVALIYISDYEFATSDYNNNSSCHATGSSWIKNGHFLTTSATDKVMTFFDTCFQTIHSNVEEATYPSVYLKPNVKITGGSGTSSSPYELSL